jgi:hypothetical protein
MGAAHVDMTAIYLRACDTCCFINTHMYNGPIAKSVVFHYSVGSENWPAGCSFYTIDPIGAGGGSFINVGTPGAFAKPNWAYGISPANGAIPPNIKNFTYHAPYQLGGSQSNDVAIAGAVGELIVSTIEAAAAVNLPVTTATNITSITLTPGDWDIDFCAYFKTAATTLVYSLIACINETPSALNLNAGRFGRFGYPGTVLGATDQSVSGCSERVSVAVDTVIYLVGFAAFGTDTVHGWGRLRARRMR